MRYFITVLLFCVLCMPEQTQAQNRTNRVVTGLDATFVDYKGMVSGKLFNPKNFNPGLRLSANVYLNGLLNYSFTSSFVPRISYPQPNGEFLPQLWMDFNTGLKIKSNTGWLLKEEARIAPYIYTGIGYNTSESINNFYLPAALGMRLRLSDMISLNLETMYRQRFEDRVQPMSHSLGVVFVLPSNKPPKEEAPMVKNKKTDEEPVISNKNKKSETEPVIANKNKKTEVTPPVEEEVVVTAPSKPIKSSPKLPANADDKDNDGIPNDLDGCPDDSGSKEDGGCPEWALVNKAKDNPSADLGTMPDADKDGIADAFDGCPNEAGQKEDGGCPQRYAVAKAVDKSIVRGEANIVKRTASASTPVASESVKSVSATAVAASDMDRLSQIARLLKYKPGTDKLTDDSKPLITEIRTIMDKYPGFKLKVAGFYGAEADSEDNKILAVTRAFQIKRLLILDQGKSPANIDSDGVVTSKSEGAANLNRIELSLIPR